MDDSESLAERVLDAFRKEGLAGAPIRASLADELVNEARPAVHSLVHAIGTDRVDDLGSLAHHECLAMVTLLGRRLASLGVTPTGAMCVVGGLVSAARSQGLAISEPVASAFVSVFLEGFVRGREEHARAEGARALVESQTVLTLAPGVVLVALTGSLDPDVLAGHVEEVGRTLLRQDAKAVIVDLSRFVAADSEAVHAVVQLVRSARVLGVAPFLIGLMGEAREEVARSDEAEIFEARTVPDALGKALTLVGLELRHRSGWPARLRGMFGKE